MASLIHEPDRPRKPWRVDWVERRQRRTKRFATKREARIFMGDVERGGSAKREERLRVEAWVLRWLETHGPNWTARTRKDRAAFADQWIFPTIGKQRLGEVDRPDVRAARAAMRRDGATVYTANRAIEVLSAAFGAAVDDDLIPVNPCRGLRKLTREGVQRRRAATLEEVEGIRAAMTRPRDRAVVSLMAYAGLRPGEVRALRWEDVQVHTLVVRAAAGSDGREKETKTGSIRPVPIIGVLADDLAELERDGQMVVDIPADHRNWTTRTWRPARQRAGVNVPPYALRHTFASLLIAEGRNPWQVAHLMGHSNPQMVISTYGHLFAEAELAEPRSMQEAAAEARHEASIRRTSAVALPTR